MPDLTDRSIIDSRELAARMRELERYEDEPDLLDEDELAELADLRNLADEVVDFEDGATLIREDHFEDYARELAEDIGAIDDSHGWPLTCIDWKQAAEDLAMDYTTVEYGFHTYYVRS